LGVLELTALPSIKDEGWIPLVRETDALLVWDGDVISEGALEAVRRLNPARIARRSPTATKTLCEGRRDATVTPDLFLDSAESSAGTPAQRRRRL
jgi:hypothetical protein